MTLAAEAELVAQARRGSAPAYARIVADSQQSVRSFLRRLGAEWADVDDLAQDTFVSAWSGLHRWRPESSLRAWLCGIAYNKWKGHLRGSARRRAREQVEVEEPTVAPTTGASIDAMRALAVLPEEQRAVVALCLAAEFSHAEAAQALGLPLGTVKSHVTRGREKLLAHLGGRDDRS
jgi:RNA polymerase sigma-70 factor (ECF subfamily)